MSSLSRTEYRREEQRRVNESPFQETKWDQHLDTLLTDLNDSVGPGGGGGGGGGGGTQQRSLVPSVPQGQVTERHGVPGSGDFHERREYLSPDQRTRVVQERYEHTNRGDDGTNQAVTKQLYQSSYKSTDHPAPQTQPPASQDNSRFKQNILELDSLLDDLDHARKKPSTNGVDPGTTSRDGPSVTSTPYRHINVQKTVNTSKYTTSSGPEPTPSQPTPGDHLTAVGLTGPRHSPSPNPLDGLDRSLVPELTEPPQPGTTRVTKYEYRSTNRRDVSPQPTGRAPAPLQSGSLPPPDSRTYVDSRREYTSTSNTLDRQPPPPQPPTTDKTVVYNVYNKSESTLPGVPAPGAPPAGVPTPVVPPAQPGSNTTINYHIYNYGTLGPDGLPVGGPGSAPPSEVGGPRSGTLPRPDINQTTTTSTYEHYRDASPPPHQHRSPAPGPDTTVSNSYVYEKHTRGPTPQHQPPPGSQQPGGPNTSYSTQTITKHYKIGPDGQEIPVRPGSPEYPKFPVDDGVQPPGGQHTRTTTTTIERTHTHGSPFPARSVSPSPHRPTRDDGPRRPFPGTPRHHVDDIDTPRRVDELMAQIPDTPQDGTYPHGPRRRDLTNGQHSTHTTHFTVHETEPLIEGPKKVTLDAKSGAVVPHTPTKPVAGMPIYYPPGSTEFTPKPDNAMVFQSYESSGGGGKYRSKSKSGWKASGKSSAKSGSSERHAEGGAVVPICLPLCCGAACSVM